MTGSLVRVLMGTFYYILAKVISCKKKIKYHNGLMSSVWKLEVWLGIDEGI